MLQIIVTDRTPEMYDGRSPAKHVCTVEFPTFEVNENVRKAWDALKAVYPTNDGYELRMYVTNTTGKDITPTCNSFGADPDLKPGPLTIEDRGWTPDR